MKRKLKMAVSTLTVASMLVSTVFSSVPFAADSAVAENAVEVSSDDTASDSAVSVEETSETTTEAEKAVLTADLTAAESGKTYSVDFAGEAAGTSFADGVLYGDGTIKVTGTGATRGDKHGADIKPNDKIEVSVAGTAAISITSCIYSSKDGVYTITDSKGTQLGTLAAYKEDFVDGSEYPLTFNYNGDADTLTLTYTGAGQAYLHKVEVENAAAPIGEAASFSVWFDDIAKDGSFEQQELTGGDYKDSKLKLIGNKEGDGSLTKFTVLGNAANLTREGKTVNGYKAGNRHATANDIPSVPNFGDGTAVVFTPAANGTATVYIWSTSFLRVWDFDNNGERYGYTDSDAGVDSVSFKAKAGHTYVMSTTGKTNNMAYAGFEYVVDEPVAVAVNAWTTPKDSTYNFDNAEFNIIDKNLGTVEGKINKGTTSINLAKGHRYIVESPDAGIGVTFAGEEVYVADADKPITLDLVEIPDVKLSGKFITSDGKANDVKDIKFVNMKSGNETPATLTADGYEVSIKPGEYQTVITSASYTTIDKVSVKADQDNTDDVYLKANDPNYILLPVDIQKAAEDQSVKYVSANAETAPIRLNNDTSIRASQGDKVVIPVKGRQKVYVSGWYSGKWNINGQGEVDATGTNTASPAVAEYTTNGTETEVTVNITGDGANYLYWIKLEDANKFDASKTTIQVPSEEFPTLKDANAYIKNLSDRPSGEAGRMTIELTADVEEQIVFDAPYVTLNGNGHQISWYYGVGSFYYSIDEATGLYDEELFYDKYNSVEGNGSLWGGVAIIRGDNFKAVDTTFKNTYNYEVTEKDAADFEHATGNLVKERKVGTDVATYNAKERSNAFYIEAKNIEVDNCKILSSQDTFGRNGSANNGYSVYVKNSVIGGNVDYICGEFTAVFDNCELQWKTYSDSDYQNKSNEGVGYIVAPKTNPYIFRNCEVTIDNEKASNTKGSYGRTWGKGSNASFIRTETNGYINEEKAWGQMSATDTDSTFYELQNTNGGADFVALTSTAAAVTPKKLPDELTKTYLNNNSLIKSVLSDWEPDTLSTVDESTLQTGDVTGDTMLTATDASTILKKANEADFKMPVEESGLDAKKFADVDGSGVIDSTDATLVLKKVLDADFVLPADQAK